MTTFSTLAERMSAGRMSAAEALRVAAACSEQLRLMHEQGSVHGALTPSAIHLGETSVELQPAAPAVTPYTAPEILAGRPADPRTDVFALGAILYEMITGRRAFEGEDDASVMLSLASTSPRPSGSLALDRVVSGCVAKSADARFQHMPKLQLELKMLASSARRGLNINDAPASGAAPPPVKPVMPAPAANPFVPPVMPAMASAMFATPSTAMPAQAAPSREIEALESRIAARLQQQDQALASVQHVANEVLAALRGGAIAPPPAPVRQPSRSFGGFNLEAEANMGRMDRAFELLNDKVARIDIAVGNAIERLIKAERQIDEFDTDAAALRDSVTRDVRNFERALKTQNNAIESARTAMGQTDDLVERVVEALDSLQSMFITSAEERAAS